MIVIVLLTIVIVTREGLYLFDSLKLHFLIIVMDLIMIWMMLLRIVVEIVTSAVPFDFTLLGKACTHKDSLQL